MGLAFDPNYEENGKFYVTVTVDNGGVYLDPVNYPTARSPYSGQVRQYGMSADPNVAAEEFNTLLEWVKPQVEHTGGWLGFSPSEPYLYIATGDGGGYDDFPVGHTPGIGNAQDITNNPMGKLLRIDPSGVDAYPLDPKRNFGIPPDNPFVGVEGDDEIFAYGLRSPWKASFDRATGDLWIGDVGEAVFEEIDFLPVDSGGGQNFGWRRREGYMATPGSEVGGVPPPQHSPPVYAYLHASFDGDPQFEGNSATGGYLYRGPDPDLQGKYIFADFISGNFWMFDPQLDSTYAIQNINWQLEPDAGAANLVTTFAEDSIGNLYVATITGSVFRILTDAVMPGDFQSDGNVDTDDLAIWREQFGLIGAPGEYSADANGNGRVGARDFLIWQQNSGHSALEPSELAKSIQPAPEPSAGLLMAIAVGSRLLRRRRPSAAGVDRGA